MRRNLNALHVARHEFVKVEFNERIRRALRQNVRNEQRWRGPGTVIGRDGKKMLVKQSDTFVRVHTASPEKLPIKNISQSILVTLAKTRELGSFDSSSGLSKNVEPGSVDGSRELRSFDSSSGSGRNVEPGSFDGSRELWSFDGSSRSGRNADLFDHRPLDADRSGAPKLGKPRVLGYYSF